MIGVSYDQRAYERWSLRELDDRNALDCQIKAKICKHCEFPKSVSITHSATDDLGLIPLTKDAVVEAVKDHINLKKRVSTDTMDNGDTAYIFKNCNVDGTALYVKVRFFKRGEIESMLIFSAHPDRRW